jgi:YidC/Oxa1 family membrane protein insertase
VDNSRNMILALVLSALVLFGWSLVSDRILPTAAPPAVAYRDGKPVALPGPGIGPVDGPAAVRDRAQVLGETSRVRISTPAVEGSLNLLGARIDDLVLVKHRQTIAPDSPPIRVLSPAGTADAYFLQLGWSGDNVRLPDGTSQWTADGDLLAPGRPVTLRWDNGAGQTFVLRLEIDSDYLVTARQTVINRAATAVTLRPYGLVSRTGVSPDPSSWTLHTGPIAAVDGAAKYGINFTDLDKAGASGERFATNGGWFGFTDKYWLTAVIPDQKVAVDGGFRGMNGRYQADVAAAPVTVAPGQEATTTMRMFAGAKEVSVLDRYESELGIVQFDRAIDWGWFVWFEKPIFYLLHWLFQTFGNFGVAIILLTVIVRGLMFPIAQKQFASMAAMRVLQPKMKAIQEKYKDDRPRQQQEIMALYQREKVNPLAGCLPIVLQIPIFYALYKVLMLSIEMRHQPFMLWIKDLSAPDPLTPLNLFGLLPFTPPQMIAIGVLPILLGITMWLQQKLNPAPMDPIQAKVFAIMPWIFMFIMAPFAAGLQLYWTVSNILTILQQKWLYSRHPGMKEAVVK